MGKEEELSEEQLKELIKARKPSTNKELTRKATEYILKQAEEANGGPLKPKKKNNGTT